MSGPPYQRQGMLLGLLQALGGDAANTDFQKLLYLYTREWEEQPTYEFVPYRFGCFSFTSCADKRKLIERGFLANDEHRWRSVPSAFVPSVAARRRFSAFARCHAGLRGDPLVREVYSRFPETAWRSEILDRVVQDGVLRRRIDEAKPRPREPGLVTIGYEGRSLEAYLNILLGDGVTILCDVRRNALSRKYGFSKKTLSSACQGVGIRYEHLSELGIDSSARKNLVTPADYAELFDRYTREHLPQQGGALARIRGWAAAGERVALMCFEKHARQCHRHRVADALAREYGDAYAPSHL